MHPDVETAVTPVEVELPAGRPRTTLDLAAAKLHTALTQRSGYVVVTAETSARAAALFALVEPRLRTFRTVRASGESLDPEAVVRALWGEGEAPFPARLAMRTLIEDARAAARPIVVAITDADRADAARLERVRLTLEGAPDAGEIVHIALLGGPALIELMRQPETRAVAMRIGATVQVPSVAAALAIAAPPGRTGRRRVVAVAATALVTLASGAMWLAWRSPARPSAPDAPIATSAAPAPTARSSPPPAPPAVEPAPPPQAVAAAPSPPPPPAAAPVPPPSDEAAPVVLARAVTPAPVATPSRAPAVADVGALQVAAFVRAASADALRAQLVPRFPGTSVSPATRDGTTYYRVRIAGFATAGDRDDAARALRAAGYAPVRVRD